MTEAANVLLALAWNNIINKVFILCRLSIVMLIIVGSNS